MIRFSLLPSRTQMASDERSDQRTFLQTRTGPGNLSRYPINRRDEFTRRLAKANTSRLFL